MKKSIIFFVLFIALNLAFIPLMSLYGLSVCPVLRIPGFRFGCAYAGTFVTSVMTINLIMFAFLRFYKSHQIPAWLFRTPSIAYFFIYLISSILGLVVLDGLFSIQHISGDSRAPEILAFASLFLGITQTYGLNWALSDSIPEVQKKDGFGTAWRMHTVRTMFPGFAGILFLFHFLVLQLLLNERTDVSMVTSDDLIEQSMLIVGFLVAWLFITYFFHFLSERECALKVSRHLNALNEKTSGFNTDLRGTWGLWRSLLRQLNEFSTVTFERMNLLKSFSRFVSNEVANRALSDEIVSVSSRSEELTVLMTDLRGFTQLSENLSASEVVDLLNSYFTVMLDVLTVHQIVVDKFIGDGILAFAESENFSSKEQNQRTVKACLSMLRNLEVFNTHSGKPKLKMGMGVHRGNLIKGNIGSITKLQNTIIGDSVNRAARLESLCKELETCLVITDEVWRDLIPETQNLFKLHQDVRVKGIASSLSVYCLKPF